MNPRGYGRRASRTQNFGRRCCRLFLAVGARSAESQEGGRSGGGIRLASDAPGFRAMPVTPLKLFRFVTILRTATLATMTYPLPALPACINTTRALVHDPRVHRDGRRSGPGRPSSRRGRDDHAACRVRLASQARLRADRGGRAPPDPLVRRVVDLRPTGERADAELDAGDDPRGLGELPGALGARSRREGRLDLDRAGRARVVRRRRDSRRRERGRAARARWSRGPPRYGRARESAPPRRGPFAEGRFPAVPSAAW